MEQVLDLFEKGGPVMWPLLLCSVVSLALAIERLIATSRVQLAQNDELVEKLFDLVSAGKCNEAAELGKGSNDPAAAMIAEGLSHRDHGLSDVMQVAAEKQLDSMRTGLSVLDTVITMAPLLGILGTVTGIIKSFNLLQDVGLQDPRLATGGISEALITTAAGLVVALATLIPYNYLISRIRRISRRLEHTGTQLEVVFRRSTDPAGKDAA